MAGKKHQDIFRSFQFKYDRNSEVNEFVLCTEFEKQFFFFIFSLLRQPGFSKRKRYQMCVVTYFSLIHQWIFISHSGI